MDAWAKSIHMGAVHGVRAIIDTLPVWISDHTHAVETMQKTWEKSWKHVILTALLPFWSFSHDEEALQRLPITVQNQLKTLPLSSYSIFDTDFYCIRTCERTKTHGVHQSTGHRNTSDAIMQPIHHITAAYTTNSTQIDDPPTLHHGMPSRVVTIYRGNAELISPMFVYVEYGSRHWCVFFEKVHVQVVSSLDMQVWALDRVLFIIQELHAVYIHSVSCHIHHVLQESVTKFSLPSHPLFFLLDYINKEIAAIYKMSIVSVPATTTSKHERTVLPPPIPTVMHTFVWNEQYLDIRQRVLNQQGLYDIPLTRLENKRNHVNAFYTRPHICKRSTYHSMYQVYNSLRERRLHVGRGVQRSFEKRCWTEEELMKLFQRVRLTTEENVQLKKWADYIQNELQIQTNFSSDLSMWPYRVMCIIADLLCLLQFQKEQMHKIQPALWNQTGSDNVLTALARIHDWVLVEDGVDIDKSANAVFNHFHRVVDAEAKKQQEKQ
jgi:hypothetical protein